MRRARWMALAVASVGLIWLAGVGGAGTAAKPKTKPAAPAPKATASWKTAPPVIPEWAPKKPSPEFLRAARVVKPLPLDSVKAAGATEAENAAKVRGARLERAAAYEFFGTLSDDQIDRLLQTKQVVVPPVKRGDPPMRLKGSQVLIPMGQLAKKQRAAVDRYLAAVREARKRVNAPGHPEYADGLLMLYKLGAARDLSNVLVGVDTAECGAGHYVHLLFRVTRPDGTADSWGNSFAQI